MRSQWSLGCALVLTLGTVTSRSVAQTGPFSIQGELRDANGPVNGQNSFSFQLFDALAGGNALSQETANQLINVVSGRYAVNDIILTPAAGQDAEKFFNGEHRYIAIKVNGVALNPRIKLQAAPLALGLKLPMALKAQSTNCLLKLQNTGTGNAVCGVSSALPAAVEGQALGADGTGVKGIANVGLNAYGVWGDSDTGFGVKGNYQNASGLNIGMKAAVWGDTDAAAGLVGSSSAVNGIGVFGLTNDGDGTGVWGINEAAGFGVIGQAGNGFGVAGDSTNGVGVRGLSTNFIGVFASHGALSGIPRPGPGQRYGVLSDTVNGLGVVGLSGLANGTGIHGEAHNGALAYGVWGKSSSGVGVKGTFSASAVLPNAPDKAAVWGDSDTQHGVLGTVSAAARNAVLGIRGGMAGVPAPLLSAGLWGESLDGNGVVGLSGTNGGAGVFGRNDTVIGAGVEGISASGFGIRGDSATGFGTGGYSFAGTGVYGQRTAPSALALGGFYAPAVWGDTNSGDGVMGTSSAVDGFGVVGLNGSIIGVGVVGGHGIPSFTNLFGVLYPGVWGDSGVGNGVVGSSTAINGAGVLGKCDNPTGAGVIGIGGNGAAAGSFFGNVLIAGTMTAAVKNFEIDHPVDPANKTLTHACIESDELANIYSGNVTTDAAGVAAVTLPDYFEALNTDYRYQLTVIGQFAQAIVSEKVAGNRFSIRTNQPHVEVSWQVTGIRKDAYALAHPLVVEREKSQQDRGKFLYPVELGQPAANAVGIIARQGEESAQRNSAAQDGETDGIGPVAPMRAKSQSTGSALR